MSLLEWSKEKSNQYSGKTSDFKVIAKRCGKNGYFELRNMLKKYSRKDTMFTKYLVELQGKIAFPLIT